jgi:hypothetical protein
LGHPELGAKIAERIGFELWEVNLIRDHHRLYDLVNLPSQNIRAIRRFLRDHRDQLENLIFLAHADIFAEISEKSYEQWQKIEDLIATIQKIESETNA